MPTSPTVADVGEDALVAAVVERLRRHPVGVGGARTHDTSSDIAQVLVGPGDDAAVLALGGPLVTSTDTLVEGVDFRLDWSDPEHVGRKAAVQVIADVEAMGAEPVGLLVALVVPGATPLAWCLGLADGLAHEAALAGAVVLGGDVADGGALVLTGTSLGVLRGTRPPVTRAGARAGDVLALSGPVGASAAGLAALEAGLTAPPAGHGRTGETGTGGAEGLALARVAAVHRCPVVDHTAGPRAREAGATAMIDVSDGLVRDAVRLARASGAVLELDTGALAPSDDVRIVADLLGADAQEWVLTSGEEHAMLAAFDPGDRLPAGFVPVGRVRPTGAGAEPGVVVDGLRREDAGGWTHYGRRP